MLNYLNGFLTSMLIIGSFFLITGAKYGGSQHFGDIIANSITITDKNGFGGVFKVVDKEGNTLLSIKNGNINIFNEENVSIVDISPGTRGEGKVSLRNGGQINTFNENGLKTTSIGENSFGEGPSGTKKFMFSAILCLLAPRGFGKIAKSHCYSDPILFVGFERLWQDSKFAVSLRSFRIFAASQGFGKIANSHLH